MFNKVKTITFAILSVVSSTPPVFVNAAGLVPCSGLDCTFCQLGELFQNIINFLIYLIFPLAAIMIVVGGLFMMTAAGSSSRFQQGKQIATAAVIGVLIALLSWLVIDTIIKEIALGWGNAALGPWNHVDLCPASL